VTSVEEQKSSVVETADREKASIMGTIAKLEEQNRVSAEAKSVTSLVTVILQSD